MSDGLVLRSLVEDDYETICRWWKWWRWTPLERHALPNNGTGGFMIQHEGVDICAGFLVTTNSSICLIEWIVSNYEVKDKILRKDAVEFLIEALVNLGKKLGFKLAFTYLLNESLKQRYETCGFIETTKPIEMIKRI